MRSGTFLGVVLGSLLVAGAASAQPASVPEPPPAPEVDRVVAARFAMLERFVASASVETRVARHWHGGTALALGGFAIGLGVTHLGEDTRVQGIVLTANGGLTILSGLYELFVDQRRFEQLRAAIAAAEVLDPAARLAAVEAAWDDLARREARRRHAFALFRTISGALLVAAGGFLAWTPDSWYAGNPVDRTRAAMAVTGTGIATTSLGVHDLLVKSPFEEARDSYRSALPSVGIGAGWLQLHGSF